jgi:hypothetical protein
MHCSLCRLSDHAEFNVEMNIHSSGLKNVGHPGVLLIQKVKVCMGCGHSRFTIPQTELAQLVTTTEKGSLCLGAERCHPDPRLQGNSPRNRQLRSQGNQECNPSRNSRG